MHYKVVTIVMRLIYDEINEDEMTSEDFFKKQSRMKNDITHEAIKITKPSIERSRFYSRIFTITL